jgi:hypothetical protein
MDLSRSPNTLQYFYQVVYDLNNSLYGPVIKNQLQTLGLSFLDYKFFITGGAATSFYLKDQVPIQDIDCTLVINPKIPIAQQRQFYRILNTDLISSLTFWINAAASFWPSILVELQANGFQLEDTLPQENIQFRRQGYGMNNFSPDVNLELLIDILESMNLHVNAGCPFRITYHSSVTFDETNLEMVLISVKPRVKGKPASIPSLLDISFYKPLHKTNEYDYDLSLDPYPRPLYQGPGRFGMLPVANPLYIYLNQKSSALTNTRPDKISSRTNRANLLEAYLISTYYDDSILSKYLEKTIQLFSRWFYEHSNLLHENDYRYYDIENLFRNLLEALQGKLQEGGRKKSKKQRKSRRKLRS